jgi:hypothetical protein
MGLADDIDDLCAPTLAQLPRDEGGIDVTRTKRTQTTLGNLILALTEEATSLSRDPEVAHRWVSYIIADLMRKRRVRFRDATCTDAITLQTPTAPLQ